MNPANANPSVGVSLPRNVGTMQQTRGGRIVLGTQVYEELRAEIIRGVVEPGENLTEIEVAGRFGVSRTPAREGLRRLEAEGLVERNGAGLVAAQFSLEAGSEVMLLRQLLEPHCGETSAPELASVELVALRSILNEMEAVGSVASSIEQAELNNRFHDTLYRRCPYPRLLGEVRRIREHYVTFWLYGTYREADRLLVHNEHRQIVRITEQIVARELAPLALREALDRHIGGARRRFEENVRALTVDL